MFGKAFCYANRVVVGVPKSPKDKYRDAPSSSILRGPSEMRPIPNKKWVVSLERMGQGVGAPLDVELGFAKSLKGVKNIQCNAASLFSQHGINACHWYIKKNKNNPNQRI